MSEPPIGGKRIEVSTNHRSLQAAELAPPAFSTYHLLVPNTLSLPTEDQVDQAAARAEEIARTAKHGSATETLPDLNLAHPNPSDHSWLKRFFEWIQDHFKFKSAPHIDVDFLLQLLKWTLIALVAAAIGYGIYWLLMRPRGPAAKKSGPIRAPVLSTEQLVAELEAALAQNQLGRAARLRWRLFLFRSGTTADLTPYEYFRSQRTTLEAWLAKQYATMFSGRNVARPDYDELSTRLESMEPKVAEGES